MLEIEPPDTYVPDDYLNNVHYFSENDTYDMTKIVSGFAIDVVKDLGRTFKALNSTVKGPHFAL